jgi:hypothetical protein
METDYKNFISACSVCQMADSNHHPVSHPMHALPNPGIPFHTWNIDWIQDLPESDQFTQIAVAIDRATRTTFALPFSNRGARESVQFLFLLMCQYGAPSVVISDRASVFLGHEFKRYCEKNGIKHFSSSSYHPQSNGAVERANGVLEGILRKLCAGNETLWAKFLNSAVFNMNVRAHTVTGYSPFYLCYGFHPRFPGTTEPPSAFNFETMEDRDVFTMRELTLLGQARAAAMFRSNRQAQQMSEQHDAQRKVQANRFVIGEYVKKLKSPLPSQHISKFNMRWDGPFIIDSVGPNDSYRLMTPRGEPLPHPVNANHLAPYKNIQDLFSSPSPTVVQPDHSDSGGGIMLQAEPSST